MTNSICFLKICYTVIDCAFQYFENLLPLYNFFNIALVVFIHMKSAPNLLNILKNCILVFMSDVFIESALFLLSFSFLILFPTKFNIQGFPFLNHLCFLLIKYMFSLQWNALNYDFIYNNFVVSLPVNSIQMLREIF